MERAMDTILRPERAILLGLIPLLGTTSDGFTALTAVVISVAVSLTVWLLSLPLRGASGSGSFMPSSARWAFLAAAGFAIGWFLSGTAPFIIPLKGDAIFFLRLIGASPVVYYSAAERISVTESISVNGIFWSLLLTIGIVREILGNGTLFGYLVSPDFTTFSGVFATPAGAFFILGLIILGARVIFQAAEKKGESK